MALSVNLVLPVGHKVLWNNMILNDMNNYMQHPSDMGTGYLHEMETSSDSFVPIKE
jgi:hypothetical protein